MRAFVEIRKVAVQHKSIAEELKLLAERLGEHDVQLGKINDTIETLLDKKQKKKPGRTGGGSGVNKKNNSPVQKDEKSFNSEPSFSISQYKCL